MIPYHQILTRMYNRPLLVMPETAQVVSSFILGRVDAARDSSGGSSAGESKIETVNYYPLTYRPDGSAEMHSPRSSRFVGEWRNDRSGRPNPYRTTDSGVAIITIIGELVNRGAWIGASSGLVSYEGIKHQLSVASSDPDVRAIVLDMESPGGEAIGCFDVAAAVRRTAAIKPVIGVINGMACSACYAIGSACTRLVTIPDGMSGSIGVVLMHLDFSEYLKSEGVKPTLIFAGAHKVDGNPYEPLPEEVRGKLKEEVDRFYSMFVATVAAGRKGLSEEAIRATEAQIYVGSRAVDAGLVDEVGTFEDVIAALEAPPSRGAGAAVRQTATKGNMMTRKAKSIQAQADEEASTPAAGPGGCTECDCDAFVGEGETCERETCGHASASHASEDSGDGDGGGDGGDGASAAGAPAKPQASASAAPAAGASSEVDTLKQKLAAMELRQIASDVEKIVASAIAAKKFGAADPKGERPTLAGYFSELLTEAYSSGATVRADKLKAVIDMLPPAPAGKLAIKQVKESASTTHGEHAAVVEKLTEKGMAPGSPQWAAEYPKALAEVRRGSAE